ncbi:hypothetical protein RR46_00087 [Papilio xuthus]|uniref:Uncharacterized protein n=1 Tax=Papilio xuthus TaxID=66420 RepID=A0A0N1PJL5_PAPXU|nr:hypothetical protein RR46_00087 [Papilio xuthus]
MVCEFHHCRELQRSFVSKWGEIHIIKENQFFLIRDKGWTLPPTWEPVLMNVARYNIGSADDDIVDIVSSFVPPETSTTTTPPTLWYQHRRQRRRNPRPPPPQDAP